MKMAGVEEVGDTRGAEVMKGKGMRNDVRIKKDSGVVLMREN